MGSFPMKLTCHREVGSVIYTLRILLWGVPCLSTTSWRITPRVSTSPPNADYAPYHHGTKYSAQHQRLDL
ncbi:hypothetical protein CY34DRAFT_155500 [Suillus luteus UH-Slu-Lm8-n1]|uniref:Uncharacterized protein n=1 Tax=Suillus luteus UH-Slu-Lm8-n1 TaxID=930992 RepID=A0A0D0B732_9AGAM|nr:hypothetical protein CY34DRAFT_155500 [Suillus luteus UH-Slu-Lm8-n1]